MEIESHIKTVQVLKTHKKALINILITAQHVSDAMSTLLKTYDLSTQQFNVLRILKGQNAKPANLSTIQERMINKMSNTSRLIDKLIDKQLVSRKICPENRRKIEILITKKGEKLLEEINPKFEAKEREITKQLSEEDLQLLNKQLNKLRTNE